MALCHRCCLKVEKGQAAASQPGQSDARLGQNDLKTRGRLGPGSRTRRLLVVPAAHSDTLDKIRTLLSHEAVNANRGRNGPKRPGRRTKPALTASAITSSCRPSAQGERIKLHANCCRNLDSDKCTALEALTQ